MKKQTYFISIITLIIFCSRCVPLPPVLKIPELVNEKTEPIQPIPKKLKNGIEKKYYEDGSLLSEVIYVHGKKEGLAKNFSQSGKVLVEIQFKKDLKEGVAKKYYPTGRLERETEYQEGKKSGDRKSYFKNGNISSTRSYLNDWPGNDLMEYYKSGKLIESSPFSYEIINEDRRSGVMLVQFSFDEKVKKPTFFFGELKEGKYFNVEEMFPLPTIDGIHVYKITRDSIVINSSIIGTFYSKKGNLVIKQLKIEDIE